MHVIGGVMRTPQVGGRMAVCLPRRDAAKPTAGVHSSCRGIIILLGCAVHGGSSPSARRASWAARFCFGLSAIAASTGCQSTGARCRPVLSPGAYTRMHNMRSSRSMLAEQHHHPLQQAAVSQCCVLCWMTWGRTCW